MNILQAAAAGAVVLALGVGSAIAASSDAPILSARFGDPCCVVISIGPGGRAVTVESVATQRRWLYYITGTPVAPGALVAGSRVDFDPLTGRLFGTDHELIAGALVSAAD
jgi:hypothetical protein